MVTTGVVRCGSVHACPVCSARICKERADELVRTIESHRRQGCFVYLLTLTTPHERRDELAGLHLGITKGWRAVWSGSVAKRASKAIGVEGYARATEVTFGERSGWHPHLHAVFVLRYELAPELTPAEMLELRACDLEAVKLLRELRALPRGANSGSSRERAKELRTKLRELEPAMLERRKNPPAPQSVEGLHLWLWRRWARAAKRFASSPSIDAGVHIVRADKAATYLAKMGLAHEIVGQAGKSGRGAHKTPWQILQAADTRRRYRGLWQEYVEAMHRQRQLTWSRKLRRSAGPERTDEQIADDAGRAIGNTLFVSKEAFDKWLRWRPETHLGLEAAMATTDLPAIRQLLHGCPGGWCVVDLPRKKFLLASHPKKAQP